MALAITKTASGSVKFDYGDGKPVYYNNLQGVSIELGTNATVPSVNIAHSRGTINVRLSDVSTVNGVAAPATAALLADTLGTSVFSFGGGNGSGVTANSYLGQVATRCLPSNNNLGGAGRWQMTRSYHVAKDNIVNPVCVFPNWRIGGAVTEQTYAEGTIKASIEYPIGVFTLAKEIIANSNNPVSFPIGNLTLNFDVKIPRDAQFWVRV